ncbi:MAG: hypothetical protein A3K45_02600 [Chloroflexi bacterium RIFOXYC12_FULL_59_14]|nr:MAG: hypothetical protein A3K45_02600 [Chloroflexi bacterium RIFOXYC12_FULL_59_14]
MTMEEQQAIQRLKDGDIGGLEFLVACHQVKAVRTAYLITRDLGLAEDAFNAAIAAQDINLMNKGGPYLDRVNELLPQINAEVDRLNQ